MRGRRYPAAARPLGQGRGRSRPRPSSLRLLRGHDSLLSEWLSDKRQLVDLVILLQLVSSLFAYIW